MTFEQDRLGHSQSREVRADLKHCGRRLVELEPIPGTAQAAGHVSDLGCASPEPLYHDAHTRSPRWVDAAHVVGPLSRKGDQSVVKRLTLLRRLEGMTPSAFASHLLGPHADIATRAPNLRGYRVNLPRDPEAAGWDAIVESWFDSEEAAAWPEPIKGELLADRPKFVGHIEFFFVETKVIVVPPTGA